MGADDSKSDICFMWLQYKLGTADLGDDTGHDFEWSLWKPADRDRIVKARTDNFEEVVKMRCRRFKRNCRHISGAMYNR